MGPTRRPSAPLLIALSAALLLSACGPATVARQPVVSPPSGPPLVTTTEVATFSQDGPPGSRQQRVTTVACPPGLTMLAGGAEAYLANGHPPNPSLRLAGTLPQTGPDGSVRWNAVIATGGVDQPGSRVSALAVCGHGGTNAKAITVSSTAPGPSAAASNAVATATCPQGTVLVGGGGAVSLTNGQAGPPQYFLTGSYPSSSDGLPAPTGPVPSSWTAIGALGGAPMTDGSVKAVAVCVPGGSTSVNVVVATAQGPTTAQSAQLVTATCPRGAILVGGGVHTGPSKLRRTLQGLHLRGSFPSGPTGAPGPGGTVATSWSVIANAGGIIALGSRTAAFALCSAS